MPLSTVLSPSTSTQPMSGSVSLSRGHSHRRVGMGGGGSGKSNAGSERVSVVESVLRGETPRARAHARTYPHASGKSAESDSVVVGGHTSTHTIRSGAMSDSALGGAAGGGGERGGVSFTKTTPFGQTPPNTLSGGIHSVDGRGDGGGGWGGGARGMEGVYGSARHRNPTSILSDSTDSAFEEVRVCVRFLFCVYLWCVCVCPCLSE